MVLRVRLTELQPVFNNPFSRATVTLEMCMKKKNFSIQLSENNTFGRMEADKVIETTINRDTKTAGGTTGNLNWNFL